MAAPCLIVVDMQNDFISGALGTKEAQAIVERAAEAIRARRAEGWKVIATLDTHTRDYPATQEGARLPVAHCIKGTWGWAVEDRVAQALSDAPRVEKPSFGSVDLPARVRALCGGAPERIALMGLCTDICVVSNALMLKAHFPETPMEVLAGCCAGVTPAAHEAALSTMKSCQIDVTE